MADLPPPGRLKTPTDWGPALGDTFFGRVRFTRRFGRPTGLTPRERVWLIVDGVDARGNILLNGAPLGEVNGYPLRAAFDVTDQLDERNELAIEVETWPPDALGGPPRPGREQRPGGLIGQVQLEIRREFAIERLAVYPAGAGQAQTLCVSGQVFGAGAGPPLRLFVTALGRELYFGDVPPGETFELSLPAGNLPQWRPGNPCQVEHVELQLLLGGEAVWETTRPTAMREVGMEVGEGVVEILDETRYREFDAAGRAIIQGVPSAWAAEVCPRLAHHPSIVAWQADQSRGFPDNSFGRSWRPGVAESE